ncbi:hypothetical protein L195_g047409, partial [Trifolium pratense]
KVLEELKISSVEEKRKLEEVIADLQSKLSPAADETVETSSLSAEQI